MHQQRPEVALKKLVSSVTYNHTVKNLQLRCLLNDTSISRYFSRALRAPTESLERKFLGTE